MWSEKWPNTLANVWKVVGNWPMAVILNSEQGWSPTSADILVGI